MRFADFEQRDLDVNGTTIHVAMGGSGPPVLLLHGYPQTHFMWRAVAPGLANSHTAICADLRGYGASAKPASDSSHAAYSKRTMAADQLAVMHRLGFERFAVVGHDRGARVALRLALDQPEAVERLAVLDIVPTETMYATLDQPRATSAWRYFFLIQPADLPERLIGAEVEYYVNWTLDEWAADPKAINVAARAEYVRSFTPQTIQATCEDYRAGATIDLEHDANDRDRKLACPLLVLWSRHGLVATHNVLAVWSHVAPDVRGRGIDCGHFLAEERPVETLTELRNFILRP